MTDGAITPDRMVPFEQLIGRENLVGLEDDVALVTGRARRDCAEL
jgi:hypothetical protein